MAALTVVSQALPLQRVQHALRQLACCPWWFVCLFYQLPFRFSGRAEERLRRNYWAYLRRLWTFWSLDWDGREYIRTVLTAFSSAAVTRASLHYCQHAFRWFEAAWHCLIRKPIRYAMPWQTLYGEQGGVYGRLTYQHGVKLEDFPGGLEVHQF